MSRILIMVLLASVAGCVTYKPQVSASRVDALISRPDFAAAKQAAPEWCRAAMRAVADSEEERDQALFGSRLNQIGAK